MLVETYLHGIVHLQVISLVGESVLCVLERAEIPAHDGRDPGSIEKGWILMRLRGKYAIFKSIESALRARNKAVVYYGHPRRGDIVEQTALRADAVSFADAVKGPKRKAPELESAIIGSASLLSHDSNRRKAKARKDLAAAATATDRLGRDNRHRQLMLLGHAEFQFGKRIDEDKRIRREIGGRLRDLRYYYRKCEKALWAVKTSLDGILADPIWGPRDATDVMGDRAGSRMVRVCEEQVAQLMVLRTEPFIFHRDVATGGLADARYMIENKRLFSAERYFARALAAVRLGLAHIGLNRVHFEFERLVQESREPGSDRRAVSDLAKGYTDKLAKFVDKLARVSDESISPRDPIMAAAKVASAIASINEKKYDAAAQLLKEAVVML